MDFALSAQAEEYSARMWDFMREEVFPAEAEWAEHLRTHGEHTHPPVMERLKASARERGLWNLFLPEVRRAHATSSTPRSPRSPDWSPVIAPEAINCQAPDTGNMETLELFATPEQRAQWLEPLLAGEIRSAFAMTEPDVASSDATNIETRIVRDGDDVRPQRPQVVDHRRRRRALPGPDRDGQDRPRRRAAPAAVDAAGADRHSRGRDRAAPADLRLPGPARPLRAGLPRRPRARVQPASPARVTASRSPRPGSARAASTTRCVPSAWPSAPSP